MTTMTTPVAQYGYCITSTPGLKQEGTSSLTEARCGLGASEFVATWTTRKEAEQAMAALVRREAGGDRNPSVWGGYAVATAWEAAPTACAYGNLAPQA